MLVFCEKKKKEKRKNEEILILCMELLRFEGWLKRGFMKMWVRFELEMIIIVLLGFFVSVVVELI